MGLCPAYRILAGSKSQTPISAQNESVRVRGWWPYLALPYPDTTILHASGLACVAPVSICEIETQGVSGLCEMKDAPEPWCPDC